MEARKMTCFCDIRRGPYSNSPVVHNLQNPIVRGFFKGCKAGARECPWKCWNKGHAALKDQNTLNYMCRFYNNIPPHKGIKLGGYVKISNCGTHKTYNYHKKLCCYRVVIPIFPPKILRYGYLCWWMKCTQKLLLWYIFKVKSRRFLAPIQHLYDVYMTSKRAFKRYLALTLIIINLIHFC